MWQYKNIFFIYIKFISFCNFSVLVCCCTVMMLKRNGTPACDSRANVRKAESDCAIRRGREVERAHVLLGSEDLFVVRVVHAEDKVAAVVLQVVVRLGGDLLERVRVED